MTSMDTTPASTFSYWGRLRSPGILGLNLGGTIFLFSGMIASVIVMMVNPNPLWALAVFLPVVVLCWIFARKDKHDRSLIDDSVDRLEHVSARRRDATLYRSGPAGMIPSGRNQLPGLAAKSKTYEAYDSYGRPFAIIHHPVPGHATVVFATDPEGGSLVDRQQVESWVAGLDQFLTALAEEPDVVAAAVGIESAPDTGAKLRRNVKSNLDPNAHPLSVEILTQSVVYPTGNAVISGFATITVALTTGYGQKRTIDTIATDLAARLPRWAGLLSVTGAGAVRPMSEQELAETVRICYDPSAEEFIEKSYAEGVIPELDWADVGPVSYDAEEDYFAHDGARSVTWQMTGAPMGVVRSDIFERFLAPHPDIPRKRVTFLYRPIEQAEVYTVAQKDSNTGGFLSGTYRGNAEAAAAVHRAVEVANGHGLVNFGLVATVTVPSMDVLPAAENALESLSGNARTRLRVAYNMQHVAFAAGLPLGLVLPLHFKRPTATKKRRRR